MKHWLMLALALGACDYIGDGNRPSVAGVQAAGVRQCAFLPTEDTAAAIVRARPTQSDDAIAAQICAAVKNSKRGSVASVAIEGVTTRKRP